jgi:hypothetical protein
MSRKLRHWIDNQASWAILIALITFGALLLRIFAGPILNPYGGGDLDIYYYFSHIVLDGGNPYTAPDNGPIPGFYGDNTVFHMSSLAGLLWIHDSKDTLRMFFILFDVAMIPLIGFYARRPRSWRLAVAVFYAFCPAVIVWTEYTGDYPVEIFSIFLIVFAVERSAMALAWAATTFLALFKWMSGFFLIPFAMYARSRMTLRMFLIASALFGLAFVSSHLPFFPDNLVAYDRREARTHLTPGHASWTQIPYDLGVYNGRFPQLFIYGGLAATYALFALRRIDIREAIALALLFAFVALPDQGLGRIVLIALPFLLLIRLTPWRYAALWAVATMAGLAVLFSVGRTPFEATSGAHYEAAHWLFGDYASLQHVLWANAPLALLVGLYAYDKWTGRYPTRDRLLFNRHLLPTLGRQSRRDPESAVTPNPPLSSASGGAWRSAAGSREACASARRPGPRWWDRAGESSPPPRVEVEPRGARGSASA